MEVTNFFPAVKRFFCSSCLVTKKLPPAGYAYLKARCKDCKVSVQQSWADMITYLVCCLSKLAGEQEPEAPVSDTQDHDDIKEWLQKLGSVVMTLWNQEAVTMEVARTAGMPEFTYGEVLLKSSAEHVNLMQPLPMQVEMCLEIEEGELVTVDDCNNNSLDNTPFPISVVYAFI